MYFACIFPSPPPKKNTFETMWGTLRLFRPQGVVWGSSLGRTFSIMHPCYAVALRVVNIPCFLLLLLSVRLAVVPILRGQTAVAKCTWNRMIDQILRTRS